MLPQSGMEASVIRASGGIDISGTHRIVRVDAPR
jgi:hypothetical protein